MRTTSEKIALALGLLCASISAVIPIVMVPQFKNIFEGFGSELPIPTFIFVYYHQILWALPFLVFYIWYRWPKPKQGALASCLLGITCLVLIPIFGLASLYLPVIGLEQAS